MKALVLSTIIIPAIFGAAACGSSKETEKPKATSTATNSLSNTTAVSNSATSGAKDADDVKPANQNTASNLAARTRRDAGDMRLANSNSNRSGQRRDPDDKGKRVGDDDDDR